MKATSSPTVMRPAITSRLPIHRTSSSDSAHEEAHARVEDALQPDQRAVAVDVFEIGGAEALELARLLAIGADHAHAGERLLRHRAHVRQLRLNPLEALVDDAAPK